MLASGDPFNFARARPRSAFTLMEMLVVISIITLLISILQPSLHRSKEYARRTKCASGLRQIGIGHTGFSDDHKGVLVEGQAATGQAGSGIYAVWTSNMTNHPEYGQYRAHGVLADQGYVDTARIFYCPSWKGHPLNYDRSIPPGGGWPANGTLPPGQVWIQTHYHYRSTFGEGPTTWRSARYGSDPNNAAIMADAFSDPNRGVDRHHVDGYNTLYLGGHVTWLGDAEHFVRDYNGGTTYHAGTTNYQLMEQVWQDFFSP